MVTAHRRLIHLWFKLRKISSKTKDHIMRLKKKRPYVQRNLLNRSIIERIGAHSLINKEHRCPSKQPITNKFQESNSLATVGLPKVAKFHPKAFRWMQNSKVKISSINYHLFLFASIILISFASFKNSEANMNSFKRWFLLKMISLLEPSHSLFPLYIYRI